MADRTVNKKGSTKAPGGLVIDRSGMTFNLEWKVLDQDYGAGVQVQWRTNLMETGKWYSLSGIGPTDTSASVERSASNYYPANEDKHLYQLTMRVRGKRAQTSETVTSGNDQITTVTTYEWSDWAVKGFVTGLPYRPVMSVEVDTENYPRATYRWETDYETEDERPFVDVEYQSILVYNSSVTDGSKLRWSEERDGWKTGTGPAAGSVTIAEDSSQIAGVSATRWVRVRSRGARGASAWRYAKHVYAQPYRANLIPPLTIGTGTGSVEKGCWAKYLNGNTTVRAEWTAQATAAHPIDHSLVQYLMATPGEDLAVPTSGVSWQDAMQILDSKDSDVAQFILDGQVEEDQCLWVRVVTVHDTYEIPSAAMLVRCGALADPEFAASNPISINYDTHVATIRAVHNSAVPDSQIAVWFRRKGYRDYCCGFIAHGDSSLTVQLPDFGTRAVAFGLQEAVIDGLLAANGAAVTPRYGYTAKMSSEFVWDGGAVPKAPTVTVSKSDLAGEAIVRWSWDWTTATRAEVSWSENPNAWESNQPPESFTVDSVYASQLRVSGLSTGTVWYFRGRLAEVEDDNEIWGPYSAVKQLDLTEPPEKPSLTLSPAVVLPKGQVLTASWTYGSGDGSAQSYGQLREVTAGGTFVRWMGHATTAHHSDIHPSYHSGWGQGTSHYLQVRVKSASGHWSEWSDPVAVQVATIPTFPPKPPPSPDHKPGGMPFSVTVTGAGAGGKTNLAIERSTDYHVTRPDGDRQDGYEGETVVLLIHTGQGSFTINREDLMAPLDDGAFYRVIATVETEQGLTATAKTWFRVRWQHQALIPSATAVTRDDVVLITPTAPAGAYSTDTVDIYRLSADKPEAIVLGGEFGVTYVDPFPALGALGGHRVVFRTNNGDYFTADKKPAWINLRRGSGSFVDIGDVIIDFGGDQVRLPYNLDLSSSWRKDFTETHYLGGAVQGDWNAAVSRASSVGSSVIALEDTDTIRAMRSLADWAGICHVRTPEGSSFAANVDVTENRKEGTGDKIAVFSLSITRVDPEGLDGMTLEEWEG